jgi:hypothetical protein
MFFMSIPPPITMTSKRAKGIALPKAEPNAKDHRISSQDTVITETCLCLFPHRLSDFPNYGGLF